MKDMKLGLQLGYWGAGPPANAPEQVAEAERLGFDSVWTAEAYGSDALTPLAWLGSQTTKLRLGTALCQLSGRTPTAMGMAAITLDHLSGGRFVLGLGVSGPQVVEGWYGQSFEKPLARTREYVDIVRQVVAREGVVTSDGPHYPLPYPGGTGLGKALKPIVHPLRKEIPIILGGEGVRAGPGRGVRPTRGPAHRRRLRGHRLRPHPDRRRHREGGRQLPAVHRPLHRWDGGQVDELPLRRVLPHGVR